MMRVVLAILAIYHTAWPDLPPSLPPPPQDAGLVLEDIMLFPGEDQIRVSYTAEPGTGDFPVNL